MLRPLGLALLALLRAVGPGQASGFTGEGPGWARAMREERGAPWGRASRMGTAALSRAGQASALRADTCSFSSNALRTPKEAECAP